VQASERRREYWRKSLTITAVLLCAWVALTVVIGYHARELHDVAILYAAIIGFYAWYLKKQDRIYGAQDGEEP
jgi:uncharacterized membrane protein